MAPTDEIQPAPAAITGDLAQDQADELRSKALTADKSTLPDGYYMSPRVIGTFVGLAFNLAAAYWVMQAAAGCLVQIDQDIGPSANIYMFTTVWVICQSVSMLLFGRNSDKFGRRNLALYAQALGIIGGIVGATAKDPNQLIGAAVILGIAAGVPGSYPLLTGELMTNKLKYLGTVIVVVPNIIATGFGPYLGIRLATIAHWRWIFYIYIILMVIGTVMWYIWYHPPSYVQLHGETSSPWKHVRQIDWIGTFLLTSGLVLFMLGMSWGGPYPWSSPRVLGLLISGGVVLVSFVLYECFFNIKFPIVPMKMFLDVRGFTCVVAISAFTGCIQQSIFIVWPSQIQYIFGSTSTGGWEQTAWMASVSGFGSWAGIIMIGPLYHILKRLRLQLLVGSIFMTAFLGAMVSITYTNRASAIAFCFLSTFPMGWGEVFTMLMVQYIVSETDLGIGFAIVAASRQVLSGIFAPIFIALYTNKLPGKLQDIVVPAVLEAGLPQSSLSQLLTAATQASQAALQAVPGMTDEILRVTNNSVADAYGRAFSYVYYFALALGAVCIIAAASLRDFDQYLTDHVSRMVYHKKDTKTDVLRVKNVDGDDGDGEKPVSETKEVA